MATNKMDKKLMEFDQLTKEVSCPKCHKLYSSPKLLPCLHALCTTCLDMQEGVRDKEGLKYTVVCPVCSETTELPKNGLESLPSAHFKQRMARLHSMKSLVEGKGRVECEECHKVDSHATTCCSTCGLICQPCLENHHLMRSFSDHVTVSLKEGQGESLEEKIKSLNSADDTSSMKCDKHRETLKMYCKTCKRLICSSCTLDSHKQPNHLFADIASSALVQRAEMHQGVALAKETHKIATDATQSSKQAQESYTKQQKVLIKAIEETFQDLHNRLELLKKKFLEDAEKEAGKQLLKFSENIQKASKKSLDTDHLVKMAEQALEHTTDQEFLSLKRFMNTRLKEMSPKKTSIGGNTECPSFMPSNSLAGELLQIVSSHIQHQLSPSLEASQASGNGVRTAEIDKEAKFVVHSLTDIGTPCIEKHTIEVGITVSRTNENVPVIMSPGLDVGTYEVKYVPTQKGEHSISIQIEGNMICRSPYSLVVRGLIEMGQPTLVIDQQEWPWGVACSVDREFYITRNYQHSVIVFNQSGKYLRKIGLKGQKSGNLWFPTGVAVDKQGNIYVADGQENGRLQKFTKHGQLLAIYSKLRNPQGVLLSRDGDKLYVCDKGHQAVVLLDTNLKEIKIFGELDHYSGTDGFENISGHLVSPHSLAEAENGTIFISDMQDIHVFTIEGIHLRKIKRTSSEFAPSGIAIDGDLLYVCDMVKNCLLVFQTNGELIGPRGNYGKMPGQFNSPMSLAVDLDGFLYVSDYANHRVQVF